MSNYLNLNGQIINKLAIGIVEQDKTIRYDNGKEKYYFILRIKYFGSTKDVNIFYENEEDYKRDLAFLNKELNAINSKDEENKLLKQIKELEDDVSESAKCYNSLHSNLIDIQKQNWVYQQRLQELEHYKENEVKRQQDAMYKETLINFILDGILTTKQRKLLFKYIIDHKDCKKIYDVFKYDNLGKMLKIELKKQGFKIEEEEGL